MVAEHHTHIKFNVIKVSNFAEKNPPVGSGTHTTVHLATMLISKFVFTDLQ